MSEKNEAESMTPAANPTNIRFNVGDISFFLKKKTNNEPRVVQAKIRLIPIIAYA